MGSTIEKITGKNLQLTAAVLQEWARNHRSPFPPFQTIRRLGRCLGVYFFIFTCSDCKSTYWGCRPQQGFDPTEVATGVANPNAGRTGSSRYCTTGRLSLIYSASHPQRNKYTNKTFRAPCALKSNTLIDQSVIAPPHSRLYGDKRTRKHPR